MKKLFFVLTVVLFAAASAAQSQAAVTLELDRSRVEINAFYNGTTVHCRGTVPAGAEVVIRVSGRPEDLHLKKKGKAGGVLWMNIGDLKFANAPKVYMLYTSKGAADTITDRNFEFSYAALADRVEIEPAGTDKDKWFGEFVKLKKHDGVYADYPGAVTITPDDGGAGRFEAELVIPPRMMADDYRIAAYAVINGRIAGKAEKALAIRQVGFPKKLSNLAFNHALAYGIFSVLIAIAAGFIMGMLFKDKGGAH